MLRRSSGPAFDVGSAGTGGGISVPFVFWWVYFMESLTGTGSVPGKPSLGALA
jgi:hypothetical protein